MSKKKEEKVGIKLPKAWVSMKHRNETSQARTNYEDIFKLVGVLLAVGVILFILLGGINQRKAWEAMKKWANNVGRTVAGWFSKGDIEVNDDGVYWRPNGTESATETDENGNVIIIETSDGITVSMPSEEVTEAPVEETDANDILKEQVNK